VAGATAGRFTQGVVTCLNWAPYARNRTLVQRDLWRAVAGQSGPPLLSANHALAELGDVATETGLSCVFARVLGSPFPNYCCCRPRTLQPSVQKQMTSGITKPLIDAAYQHHQLRSLINVWASQ
jgi:hypothetical protein